MTVMSHPTTVKGGKEQKNLLKSQVSRFKLNLRLGPKCRATRGRKRRQTVTVNGCFTKKKAKVLPTRIKQRKDKLTNLLTETFLSLMHFYFCATAYVATILPTHENNSCAERSPLSAP